MAQANYQQVISEIKTLDLADQLRLLEDMVVLIRENAGKNRSRSILELKGKGKHIWKGIDVNSYIDRERSSWNG